MDAYNANPSSLSHALSNLATQKTSTFFIIGDMRELGEESLNEHANILKHATDLGLKGIAIGEHFYQAGQDMSMTVFSDKPAAIEWLEAHPPHDKTILLKGSRGMKLEELLPFL
jgi:UDP-N-acetylmuramoyl-tripeptide--D-alanyl-D-alanine ligase